MIRTLLTPVLAFALLTAFGQAGSNDPTFNPMDVGGGTGSNGDIRALVVQPDGKIIIGGEFTRYRGGACRGIARLNADGAMDTTFIPGSGANGTVYSIALQPDGKIILGGEFTVYSGTGRHGIARLNPDGELDTTFDPGTAVRGPYTYSVNSVNAIAVQPDGKVIIGGAFTLYNGMPSRNIARLNADGSLDTSFSSGSGANSTVRSLCLQTDGKIILGGFFSNYNGITRMHIARLNTDGSLDTGFDTGTGTDGSVYFTTIQSDGKILIGGGFAHYSGVHRSGMARLNSDASLDTAFVPEANIPGDPLSLNFSAANAISPQPDGKIIVGGSFAAASGYNDRRNIARMNPDGSVDTTFDIGNGTNSNVYSMALDANGKILLAGAFSSCHGRGRRHIARLHPDGTLDIDFDRARGPNDVVNAIAVQSDGKIIIGGEFSKYDDERRHQLARLNPDGSLDADLPPNAGVSGTIYCILIQPDGKIIVGGGFYTCNGTDRYNIARLNPDGSLDTAFEPSPEVPSRIFSMALQADGKVLVGGWSAEYISDYPGIARLNTDGSLDTGFSASVDYTNLYEDPAEVRSIAVQPDGRILIGGIFDDCDNAPYHNIARLTADGSLDTSFNPDPGWQASGAVNSIIVQPNGKIIVAGAFSHYYGLDREGIIRLNANGDPVATFNSGPGAFDVEAAILQPDGKIIIAGGFETYNGIERHHIARLNGDGSLDTAFDPGSGANSFVHVMAAGPDGKILIAGRFLTEYDGAPRTRLARVIACNDGEPCAGTPGFAPPQHEAFMEQPDANVALRVWPNPSNGGQLHLLVNGLGDDLRQIEVELYDAMGRRAMDTTLPVEEGRVNTDLEVDHMAQGIYMLKVHEGERTSSERVVVSN